MLTQQNTEELKDEEFEINLAGEATNGKASIKKINRHRGIFSLIKSNPEITMGEMAAKLNVNERTIHRDIEELKTIIRHVGSTKGGHWEILTVSKSKKNQKVRP